MCIRFIVAGGHALQRFITQPKYTEVNPNNDTILACKIHSKKGTCSWQKDNKPLGMYPKKYEWAGNQDTGDCSLRIRSSTLQFDDGEWECQVTASDFTTQDALTSAPARLVVRVAPQRPRIEYNSSQVLPGHNVSVAAGKIAAIKCISRYGNPPARLKWFLDGKEVRKGVVQNNRTEVDNTRTWLAMSVLEIEVAKLHHRKSLQCSAYHQSYEKKFQSIEVSLDVIYHPEVRLEGVPTYDVEEGQDDVVVSCVTDANPPANIVWRKEETKDIVSSQETLQFRPVKRRDTGNYTCKATNVVGESIQLSFFLNVKYSPEILSVGPHLFITAPLFSTTTLNCSAKGNPEPTVEWFHKVGDRVDVRATQMILRIKNVTYDDQGEYECRASNVVKGEERERRSDPISLQVVGAPQVLRQWSVHEVVVPRGEDAIIRLVVCADPSPRRASWLWNSLRLESGTQSGKYHAEDLLEDEREDCYQAKLHVREVDSGDETTYYLSVENEKGEDRHAVHLAVTEPLSLTTLLLVAAGSIFFITLIIILIVLAVRRDLNCFYRTRDFQQQNNIDPSMKIQ